MSRQPLFLMHLEITHSLVLIGLVGEDTIKKQEVTV